MANVNDGSIPDPMLMQTYFEVDAEPVHLYVQRMLSDYAGLASHANIKAVRNATIDAVIFQLTSWCVAGKIPSNEITERVSWPDGAWQMFKFRHMPKWFVARFPIREVKREFKTTVNHYFVCPHLNTDHQDHHIKFMATGTRQAGMIGTPERNW